MGCEARIEEIARLQNASWRPLWRFDRFAAICEVSGKPSRSVVLTELQAIQANPNRSLTSLRSPSKSIRNGIIINLLTFPSSSSPFYPPLLHVAHLPARRSFHLSAYTPPPPPSVPPAKPDQTTPPLPHLHPLLHYPLLPFFPIRGLSHPIFTMLDQMMLINIRTAFHFRRRRGRHLMHHIIR